MQNADKKVHKIMRLATKCGVSSVQPFTKGQKEYFSSIGGTWGFCIRADNERVFSFECHTTYLKLSDKQFEFSKFLRGEVINGRFTGRAFDECFAFFTN